MSFIKSIVQSLCISALFMLVGLSLFVGNFPPTPTQIKGVFAEYKKMMKLKEHLMDQYANKDPAELVEAMQKGQMEQLKALAASRGQNAKIANDIVNEAESTQSIQASAQAQVEAQIQAQVQAQVAQAMQAQAAKAQRDAASAAPAVPAQQVVIPNEVNEQLYQLKSEMARLNQRIVELENELDAQKFRRK